MRDWHLEGRVNMPDANWPMPMVVGGIFIIIGLAGILWGRREKSNYDYQISSRPDLREFLDNWPQRPEPGALKVGGWIAVAVGLFLLLLGAGLLIWG